MKRLISRAPLAASALSPARRHASAAAATPTDGSGSGDSYAHHAHHFWNEPEVLAQLSTRHYGPNLAYLVAQTMMTTGHSLCYTHRDYCGVGIFTKNALLGLGATPDSNTVFAAADGTSNVCSSPWYDFRLIRDPMYVLKDSEIERILEKKRAKYLAEKNKTVGNVQDEGGSMTIDDPRVLQFLPQDHPDLPHFAICHCHDGHPSGLMKGFDDDEELVEWLSGQSDLTMSGISEEVVIDLALVPATCGLGSKIDSLMVEKEWFLVNNQRLTGQRLTEYINFENHSIQL